MVLNSKHHGQYSIEICRALCLHFVDEKDKDGGMEFTLASFRIKETHGATKPSG